MNLQTRDTMMTVAQVLVGLVLCVGIGAVLIYSRLPIFWEHEDLQPHVYSITWRSGVMLVVLLALTQGISFLIFRRVRLGRDRTSDVRLGH
jgi:hypothetical protein